MLEDDRALMTDEHYTEKMFVRLVHIDNSAPCVGRQLKERDATFGNTHVKFAYRVPIFEKLNIEC